MFRMFLAYLKAAILLIVLTGVVLSWLNTPKPIAVSKLLNWTINLK